jgi:uncharacterized DUF497 family protein
MTYTESVRFEWDPHKDQANQKKHGLSFDQAVELFTGDKDYLEIYDEGHSDEEDRFLAIGPIRGGVVVVVYTGLREDVNSGREREESDAERDPASAAIPWGHRWLKTFAS